jgi:iron complex transport system substrate-binding protein
VKKLLALGGAAGLGLGLWFILRAPEDDGTRYSSTLPARASGVPQVPRGGFPLRLHLENAELVLARPPARILATNAAWLDYVSALVGPERCAAVPAEAFGYSRLSGQEESPWGALPRLASFSGEHVLALAPDLVLAHRWQSAETLAAISAARVPVLVLDVPESWEAVLDTLELLGALLDEPGRAQELALELEARRTALANRAARFAGQRGLCYTNLGAGGWVAGGRTTGDVLLTLAGLTNAAAVSGIVGDAPAEKERLFALAPDVIVVGRPDRSESAPPSAEFLLGDPALEALPAVRDRRIVALPPQLFTTASPELLRGAEVLVDELLTFAER